MTSSIQYTPISLPEIEVSDNWDDLNFLPQTEPPRPPTHQTELVESDAITTGLTRALSLPRHFNRSSIKKKEEEENIRTEVINIATSNPSHLFWVPASQHPEIAPAEFEKYVDTHGLTIRKKSIKRRQSILSVYFTANDQQKLLEEIAEQDRQLQSSSEESEANEGGNRKLILRRSVSLQLPTAGGYARNVPDLLVFDRNSSPFDESRALVPKGDRPLLRRGARTNFKRNSSVTASNRPALMNRKSESDCVADQPEIEIEPMIRSSSADGGVTLSDQNVIEEPLSPVVETEEIRDLCIASRPTPQQQKLDKEPQQPQQQGPIILERSVSASTANLHSGRKSHWSWAFWSDEKSSKKNNKIDPTEEQVQLEESLEQENNSRQPQVSKSSDAASTTTTNGSSNSSTGKRFTLSSLFSRKSKHTSNLDSVITNSILSKEAPKDFQLNRMNITRLPLHVERAIYKLSHVKLANPRRPLHEQVLISNQMFWYLSIIATNPPDQQQQQQHYHHRQQQQKKKKPRKLVKKQRPPSPSIQQQHGSKLTQNSIVSGGTFMTKESSSTGFVVPDNYLNPKYQKKKSKKVEYDPKLSDSSSGEEEEEEDIDDEEDEDDDEDRKNQDDLPLALYKTTSHRTR